MTIFNSYVKLPKGISAVETGGNSWWLKPISACFCYFGLKPHVRWPNPLYECIAAAWRTHIFVLRNTSGWWLNRIETPGNPISVVASGLVFASIAKKTYIAVQLRGRGEVVRKSHMYIYIYIYEWRMYKILYVNGAFSCTWAYIIINISYMYIYIYIYIYIDIYIYIYIYT